MLDPFGYQQNVNIFSIKVKCLDPKTYADRERKTSSFFINKLAKFLQDSLFATAFKGHEDPQDLETGEVGHLK